MAFKKRIPSKLCILCCSVWLKSVLFNLCTFLVFFSERRQSTLFQILLYNTRYFMFERISKKMKLNEPGRRKLELQILLAVEIHAKLTHDLFQTFKNLLQPWVCVQGTLISVFHREGSVQRQPQDTCCFDIVLTFQSFVVVEPVKFFSPAAVAWWIAVWYTGRTSTGFESYDQSCGIFQPRLAPIHSWVC